MEANQDNPDQPVCTECGEPMEVPMWTAPPTFGDTGAPVSGMPRCTNKECPRNGGGPTDEFGFPLDH